MKSSNLQSAHSKARIFSRFLPLVDWYSSHHLQGRPRAWGLISRASGLLVIIWLAGQKPREWCVHHPPGTLDLRPFEIQVPKIQQKVGLMVIFYSGTKWKIHLKKINPKVVWNWLVLVGFFQHPTSKEEKLRRSIRYPQLPETSFKVFTKNRKKVGVRAHNSNL